MRKRDVDTFRLIKTFNLLNLLYLFIILRIFLHMVTSSTIKDVEIIRREKKPFFISRRILIKIHCCRSFPRFYFVIIFL